ncbi:hypothetical protein CBOM_07828 [Ceraceosorus bombacis]|uniref:Secreted protein n=1 Tax=Ceraceosorus bombacis TaxID=401625 RepID=A0A0P1BPW9_9BASI|nr:hypothetical protein CBOM_07828 [Ceraceosorus bombacis]
MFPTLRLAARLLWQLLRFLCQALQMASSLVTVRNTHRDCLGRLRERRWTSRSQSGWSREKSHGN